MKPNFFVVLFFFTLSTTTITKGQTEDYTDPSTGITFPAKMDEFRLLKQLILPNRTQF